MRLNLGLTEMAVLGTFFSGIVNAGGHALMNGLVRPVERATWNLQD